MQCPLCSSTECTLVHNRVWSIDSGRVFRCHNCDVTYIDPLMSEEDEREFYKSYNEHVKKRGVSPAGSAADLHARSQAAADERLTVVGELFSDAECVLEIGAATGAFVQRLSGKRCFIVEPAEDNRRFAAQFVEKTYADLTDIDAYERFDIICMFHVFEHIRNPGDFLALCRRYLRDGGLVIIEVPHSEDPLLSLYDCEAYKDFYFQPMHPFVHSLTSLRSIFQAQGFTEKRVIYHQRYGLVNHLNWLAKGTPGGNSQWSELLGENADYSRALVRSGLTDTLYYVAEAADDI